MADDMSYSSEDSITPSTAQVKPDQIGVSYSSEDSITPSTAQVKPDQIGGDTMTFVISGSAQQINPIQANYNSGDGFTINNSHEAPGGSPTRDIPTEAPKIGTGQKVGRSSKNSSTPKAKAQKKRKQAHGGNTAFEISGSANQINPAQLNQNSGNNLTIKNSFEAPVGNPTMGCSSKDSNTPKAQKKRKQTQGDTTTFEISGWANQINPIQANQNLGENFTISNTCKAPVSNTTKDIEIFADEKAVCSRKISSTLEAQNKPNQTHDETPLNFGKKLKLQPMSSSSSSGGTMTSGITDSVHQVDPSQANRNSGKASEKRRR